MWCYSQSAMSQRTIPLHSFHLTITVTLRSASAARCDCTKLSVTDVASDLVIKVVELICWEEQDSWLTCIWWMNYPPRQLSRVTDCFSAAELMNNLCSWNVGTVWDQVLTHGNRADIVFYGIHTCVVWYSVTWCGGLKRRNPDRSKTE